MPISGEGGIRTLGTSFEVHTLSRRAHSTTLAPLRVRQATRFVEPENLQAKNIGVYLSTFNWKSRSFGKLCLIIYIINKIHARRSNDHNNSTKYQCKNSFTTKIGTCNIAKNCSGNELRQNDKEIEDSHIETHL